jgi:hypothetical protein
LAAEADRACRDGRSTQESPRIAGKPGRRHGSRSPAASPLASAIGVADSGPLAEPAHRPDPLGAVGHVVPPRVELRVPHPVELVLAAGPVVPEPLDAGLPACGGLGAPGSYCGEDSCRADHRYPFEGAGHDDQDAAPGRHAGAAAPELVKSSHATTWGATIQLITVVVVVSIGSCGRCGRRPPDRHTRSRGGPRDIAAHR